MTCPRSAILLVIFSVFARSVPVRAQQRHWRETESETLWARRYGNCDHGFFMVLPPGVIGHGSKAPAPDHGFMVNLISPASDRPLWQQQHRVIWVNEDHVLEPGKDAYTNILQSGKPVLGASDQRAYSVPKPTHLGPLTAVFIRTTYSRAGKKYVTEEIAALSRDKGIEYTITLDTTPNSIAKDEEILRQIVAGFHVSQIDKSGKECSNE